MGKKKANRRKQPNSGKAFTAEKREAMFQVFFKHGTINSVVEKCRIHSQTAKKYRKADNWDHRAEEIKRKAAAKIDNDAVKRLSDNMKLVLFTKKKLMEEIKDDGVDSKRRVADLDKLIRLEEFLSGSPDSRPEFAQEGPKDIEGLKRLLQQKKEQLKNLNSNSK